jgi:hypothetical protein
MVDEARVSMCECKFNKIGNSIIYKLIATAIQQASEFITIAFQDISIEYSDINLGTIAAP